MFVRTRSRYKDVATTKQTKVTSGRERERKAKEERENWDPFRACPRDRFHAKEAEDAKFAGI